MKRVSKLKYGYRRRATSWLVGRAILAASSVLRMATNENAGKRIDLLTESPSVGAFLDQVEELREVARKGSVPDLVKYMTRTGWIAPIVRENMSEPWVGTAEVAKLLGQTPAWVRARASLLPHIRVNRQYRFRLSEIEAWYKQWFDGDRMEFLVRYLHLGMESTARVREQEG